MYTYVPQSYERINITSSHKNEVLFTTIVTILVFVFCGLSLVYLSHTNAVATKGYKIKQLQEERSELQAEVDVWNLKLVELRSLHTLNNSEKVNSMANIKENPQYIKIDTQLASR